MGWPHSRVPPQVRDAFGFREFARADEDKLADWLASEVCPVELRDEQLREALLVRCRAERLEPPGRVERIIGSARAAFEQRFCDGIVTRLGEHCAERLEDLASRDLLAQLKADPGRVGLETLLREIDKLNAVRSLRLPADLFADASDKLIEAWRARASRCYPSDLRAAPRSVRLTLLAALCWVIGGDLRCAGGSAGRAGAQDQYTRRSSGGAGIDRRSAPGARQGGDPIPARRGRGRAPRRHRARGAVSSGQ